MNMHVAVLTEKLKRFIELEDENALLGTIRYKRPKRDPEKEKGSRFLIAPNFGYPTCFDERPISVEGRVAFHFKHTFVVKRAAGPADRNVKGSKNRLAVTGDKDAASHAEARGYSTDAAGYEAYISRPEAVMSITAQAFDQYMVAGTMDAGGGAVFTNIHADLEKREAFWAAVTSIERNPSRDVVTFHPDLLPAADWRSLGDDLSVPEEARTAMLQAAQACEQRDPSAVSCKLPTVDVELEGREFTKLRKLLRGRQLLNRSDPAVTIKRGRGGRVQRRMVGELPKGLDAAARVRIAQNFASYLAEKKMMYTVVIHAPDAYNHKDNYHLHAVAYDRPCKFLEQHGCWDFEYTEKDKYGRTRYPFRQRKLGELTRPSDGKRYREHGAEVVTEMRRVWEECCNNELRSSGINRLFDHRSYKAMNILQEPGRHLGTRAAALEAIGVPTFIGMDNAEKSWAGAMARIHQVHAVCKRLRADCREEAYEILRRAALHTATLPQVPALEKQVREMSALDLGLGDQERDLALSTYWLKMANSRAEDTIRRCKPILDAIEDGTAKPADVRCEKELEERVQAAEQHLAGIRQDIAEDLEKVAPVSVDVEEKVSAIALLMSDIQILTHGIEKQLSLLPQAQLEVDRSHDAGSSPPTDAPRQSRRSRQLQEYFEAPLDYEEEWDRVFHWIKHEQLEILRPNANGPIYRVPGIKKEELDRLTNPIFRERSQARLKAMYQVREWNQERAGRASAASLTSTGPEPASVEETQVIDVEHNARYATLRALAERKAAENRAEAVADWLKELDHSRQRLPVQFRANGIEFDVQAVPEQLRAFAERMGEYILPLLIERVAAMRHKVVAALEANPTAVCPIPSGFTYYLDRFPEELRANVAMLLHGDEATRSYALSVAQTTSRSAQNHQAAENVEAPTNSSAPSAAQAKPNAAPSKQMPAPGAAGSSSGYTDEQIARWQQSRGLSR